MRDKTYNAARSREQLRVQLMAQLGDKQRQLNENTERSVQYEKIIRECREMLEEGRDRRHIRWLIPTLMLAVGAAFLFSIQSRFLGWICLVLAIISLFRWFSDYTHCMKKYGRTAKRLHHNIDECDKLNERSSALRLETLEIRQMLDALEREQRS